MQIFPKQRPNRRKSYLESAIDLQWCLFYFQAFTVHLSWLLVRPQLSIFVFHKNQASIYIQQIRRALYGAVSVHKVYFTFRLLDPRSFRSVVGGTYFEKVRSSVKLRQNINSNPFKYRRKVKHFHVKHSACCLPRQISLF